jgi:aromatic-L-amino-acid decarboxylase
MVDKNAGQDGAPFESLDPQSPRDWDEMRALAHRMTDDAIDYLRDAGQRPVWNTLPEQLEHNFNTPIPQDPTPANRVYQEFTETIMPYPLHTTHPRFWAWYMGSGTVMGALGDFLAATLNSNLGGGRNGPILVEQQVVNWMKQVLKMPESASGLLVSGGSMANLVGLTVARNKLAGFDVRQKGIQGTQNRLTVYASTEAHSSIQKAVELLGIGCDCLRKIAVNDDFTMDIDDLKQNVARDLDDGFRPVCIVATSGTVNTGAVDDLHTIADFCNRQGIWFHVDGAIGAVAMMSDTVGPLLSGIERADSIALDLHKLLHIPFEAGCALVRDADAHKSTFSLIPEYLEKGVGGISSQGDWFSEFGVELSRSFKALKVWMTIKEHGTRKLGRMITRNFEQARYLAQRINNEDDFELLAPVGMDIVCFRFNPGGLDNDALNRINRDLLVQVQEQNIAAPSYTTLQDRYCIRVAISNHRSRQADFDEFVDETQRIARALVQPG